MTASIDRLREDLKTKVTDPFVNGDVIRWTSGERYIYAAVKTSAGWFTTAGGGNGNYFVPGNLDYEELLEVLAKSDVTEVETSTRWDAV